MNHSRPYIRKLRYAVQWAVFALVVFAGVRFLMFTRQLEQGMVPSVGRPPSVEGFMPIGALMALKLWVTEGVFDPVHPAALVLFCGAILLAILLKKSFCSWICPVGALSEVSWGLGKRAFGRNFAFPRYIDYPLRSVKYVLLAFFLYAILIRMSSSEVVAFLNTPYWKVSDIKLLKFFTEMTGTTQITLLALFGLSLFYKNFWCRYLCPYGGLLGLLSLLSPVKVTRNDKACIDCGLCSRNCPSLLPVDKKVTVRSPECTGCLTCVSHCPEREALNPALAGGGALSPLTFFSAVVVIFFGLIVIAQITGRWHSSISPEELLTLIPFIDVLGHP